MSKQENFRVTVIASVPGESNKGGGQSGDAAFPRSARLLRHADFEMVYKQGRRHFSSSMTVFYLVRPETSKVRVGHGLRIGFTVGRALGGAVQRNRIKRRLRELVRLSRPWPAADADVVINPKKSLLTLPFETLLNEVRQIFVAIEKKLSKGAEQRISGARRPESGSRT